MEACFTVFLLIFLVVFCRKQKISRKLFQFLIYSHKILTRYNIYKFCYKLFAHSNNPMEIS